MKVKNLVIQDRVSKKGNKYKCLVAITEDNQEIFICYVNIK